VYKSIYLARRNAALTPEAFRERWKQHSALTGTTQRIRPYFTQVVQCARHDGIGPVDATTDFDGANLLGLVERSGGYGVFDEPEHRDIMLPDELLTFSGPIRDCTLVTREHVCKPDVYSRYLVLRFLKFAEREDIEAQFERWCEDQSAQDREGIAADLVRRSVANLVVEPPPHGMDFDFVTETWFADAAAIACHARDHQRRLALNSMIGKFCVPSGSVTFVARVNHSRPPIDD
jgi:hypothetical protein